MSPEYAVVTNGRGERGPYTSCESLDQALAVAERSVKENKEPADIFKFLTTVTPETKEKISIPKHFYEELIEDSCTLAALQAVNVGEWEGYHDALKILNGWTLHGRREWIKARLRKWLPVKEV